MNNVKDKVVLITGASSGIGAQTAKTLAEHGAKVVLGARREERLRTLAQEIGPAAAWLSVDVRAYEDMEKLAQLAISRFGKIDALFANAGIIARQQHVSAEAARLDGYGRHQHQRRAQCHGSHIASFSRAETRTYHRHILGRRHQVRAGQRGILRHEAFRACHAGFVSQRGGQ